MALEASVPRLQKVTVRGAAGLGLQGSTTFWFGVGLLWSVTLQGPRTGL